MLVFLVLILLVAVAGLGLFSLHLYDEIGRQTLTRRPATGPSRGVAGDESDLDRIVALESRTTELARANDQLRTRLEEAERSLRAAREAFARTLRAVQSGATPGDTDPGAGDPNATGSGLNVGGPHEFDEHGQPVVTAEDEEFFLAVQQRVERRRRIDGMTRNVMRRVDRLVDRGEIGRLTPDIRAAVEERVKRYVAAGDDLVTRYVRDPTPEIEGMSRDDRNRSMTEERDKLVADAQRELEPLVGDSDASMIADVSLQNPWGLRVSRDRAGNSGG